MGHSEALRHEAGMEEGSAAWGGGEEDGRLLVLKSLS